MSSTAVSPLGSAINLKRTAPLLLSATLIYTGAHLLRHLKIALEYIQGFRDVQVARLCLKSFLLWDWNPLLHLAWYTHQQPIQIGELHINVIVKAEDQVEASPSAAVPACVMGGRASVSVHEFGCLDRTAVC